MTGPGNLPDTHGGRTRRGIRKDGHRHAPHHSPPPRKGKSAPVFRRRCFASANGLWSSESRQLKKGSVNNMAGKAPRGGSAKKEPKLTLKEKREAKRVNAAPTAFIKPRKAG